MPRIITVQSNDDKYNLQIPHLTAQVPEKFQAPKALLENECSLLPLCYCTCWRCQPSWLSSLSKSSERSSPWDMLTAYRPHTNSTGFKTQHSSHSWLHLKRVVEVSPNCHVTAYYLEALPALLLLLKEQHLTISEETVFFLCKIQNVLTIFLFNLLVANFHRHISRTPPSRHGHMTLTAELLTLDFVSHECQNTFACFCLYISTTYLSYLKI